MRLILIGFFTFLSSICFSQSQSYLIKAAKFYDSEKNVFLTNQEILITGNTIAKVGTQLQLPEGTEVIDLGNATVTPGLIDAHTHLLTLQKAGEETALDGIIHTDGDRLLRAVSIARQYLEAGITTIRDLGNSGLYLDVDLRNAWRNQYFQGPRMFVSGPIISPPGGQWNHIPANVVEKEYRTIRNVQEAQDAVKEHVYKEVDLIKITVDNSPNKLLLTDAEIKAIVEAAHSYGLPVTAHATDEASVRRAVLAGVDGIEHGYYIADSTLALMARKGVYLVPTDVSLDGAKKITESMGQHYSDEQLMQYPVSPWQKRLQRAVAKGVVIVAGSDKYLELGISYGASAKDVLIAYYEAKIKAADVLRYATWNAGVALRMKNKIGVIKPGALADIVAFEGDLEADFKKALLQVKMVMQNGHIYLDKTSGR